MIVFQAEAYGTSFIISYYHRCVQTCCPKQGLPVVGILSMQAGAEVDNCKKRTEILRSLLLQTPVFGFPNRSSGAMTLIISLMFMALCLYSFGSSV